MKRHIWTGTVWRGRGVPEATPTPPSTAVRGSLPVGEAEYSLVGGELYVSPAGNDTTGAGTVGSPYKTLAKAASLVANSGTIVMRAGIYNEGGGSGTGMTYGVTIPQTRTGVTVQNYPGEAVWMEGVAPVTGWSASGSVWTASHSARYDNSPSFSRGASEDPRPEPGWKFVNPLYPCANWANQVVLRDASGNDTVLQPVPTLGEVVPGTYFMNGTYPYTGVTSGTNNQWVHVVTSVSIGDDPAGKTVLVTNKSTALLLFGTNTTLRGVGVRYYGTSMCDWGTISARNGSTLENVHLRDCTGMGSSALGTDVTWRLCTVERMGNLGMHGDFADRYTFDRCIVRECANRHFNYAPSSGGIKVSRLDGLTVTDCYIGNNYANGIWTDVSVANGIFSGNDIVDNERRGVVWELSDNLIFVNNIIAGNGSDGLMMEPSDKLHIWNNIFDSNGWGIDRFTAGALNGHNIANLNGIRKPPPGVGSVCAAPSAGWAEFSDPRRTYPDPNMTWECHKLVIKNNIISRAKSSSVRYMEDHAAPYELSWWHTNPETGGNLYHYPSTASWRFVGTKKDTTGHYVMNSLAAVRSSATTDGIPAQEVGSVETTTVPVGSNRLATTAAKATAGLSLAALPSNIAAAAGVTTGTQRLGAWRS